MSLFPLMGILYNKDPSMKMGIIIGVLILRPFKGFGLLIMGLHRGVWGLGSRR